MKYLLFLAFLGASSPLFAQKKAPQKTNEQAIAEMAALRTSGNFSYKIGENRFVNVNYYFAPVQPSTIVDFVLHTPNPRPLWLNVTDATGKVVAEWKPTEPKYRYVGQLDLTKLKPGKYNYNIYWESDLAHSISFTKK